LISNRNELASTVCLLDDDSSVLKATSRLLNSAGWTTQSFTDPVAFLDFVESNQSEVVAIDIRMPAMDGLEVQRRVRKLSPLTRVIILTSNDDPAVRQQALDNGAAGFFLKPVPESEFLAGVASASRNGAAEIQSSVRSANHFRSG
jgi:FixJ family two-component response regulator